MGCNVKGLKRLPRDTREIWKDRIMRFLEMLSPRLDCMLVTLRSDAHQWAYLVATPENWGKKLATDARLAFEYLENGINPPLWYREDKARFLSEIETLVYTKNERLVCGKGEMRQSLQSKIETPSLFQSKGGINGT